MTVSRLTEDGTELVVEAGSGQRADEYVGQRFAVEGTPSGAALATGTPLPVTDDRALSIDVRTISSDFDAGPVMLVPLVGGQRTWGLMTVVRTRGRPVFSPEDLAMASDFRPPRSPWSWPRPATPSSACGSSRTVSGSRGTCTTT